VVQQRMDGIHLIQVESNLQLLQQFCSRTSSSSSQSWGCQPYLWRWKEAKTCHLAVDVLCISQTSLVQS